MGFYLRRRKYKKNLYSTNFCAPHRDFRIFARKSGRICRRKRRTNDANGFTVSRPRQRAPPPDAGDGERAECAVCAPAAGRSATTPQARKNETPHPLENNRYGKNHTHGGPPHRKNSLGTLRRLAAPPRRAAEFGRIRARLRHDCRRAGAHRQRRQPRKGAPEHHRGGARLPLVRPRPRAHHHLHPVADSRAVRAGLLLHEPGHRGPSAAQPDGEGRNPAPRLLGCQRRGGGSAAPGHSRGLLHLPHQPGLGHHGLPRHHRAGRTGPGADD